MKPQGNGKEIMKYFFWLSSLAYVFVYFYAAWIYDGFPMPVAIIGFIVFVGFIYWRYKRHLVLQAELEQKPHSEGIAHAPTKPLSIWRSPVPYVGAIALIALFIGFQL